MVQYWGNTRESAHSLQRVSILATGRPGLAVVARQEGRARRLAPGMLLASPVLARTPMCAAIVGDGL